MRCPFCEEDDFDAIGLKNHFLRGWCEVFESTPTRDPVKEEKKEKDNGTTR